MTVRSIATIQLVATYATVLDQAIGFTVTATHVKVSQLNAVITTTSIIYTLLLN
jgi:hypothetical protein